MSFTLQTGVVLDRPPIVLQRATEGGPARAIACGLTGQVIAQEMALTQEKSRLVLYLALVSDAQRIDLETALNTAGPRTVNTGAESPTCIPGTRAEHEFKELVADQGFEDVDANSNALPAELRQWAVKVTYYRLS